MDDGDDARPPPVSSLIACGHSGADLFLAGAPFYFYRLYLQTGDAHYAQMALQGFAPETPRAIVSSMNRRWRKQQNELRRVFMRTIAVFVLAFALVAGSVSLAAVPARPNIVVILADDLGFSDIGCYGSEIATPNIDALAKAGVRYSRFYNCARCCPSRAALMTGLYPHQAGVGDMVDSYAEAVRKKLNSPAYSDHLSRQAPTIAEVLQGAGYHTLMAGKWHLGYRPEEWPAARGFEQSFAQIEGAMNYYGYGPQHSLPRGERGYVPMSLNREAFTPPQTGFFTTEAYTDFAVRQLRERRANDPPFFLYLAYNAPHWPLHAHPATIAKYRHSYDAGWDEVRAARYQGLRTLGIIDAKTPLAPRPEALPAWADLSAQKQATWKEWMAV